MRIFRFDEMEQKPEDIPKEELLQLCMKLNKRMQAMETRGKEILKKKNTLQLERQKLLSLLEAVVHVPLQPSPIESDLDFENVEQLWNDWDKKRREHLVYLERNIDELKSAPIAMPSAPSSVDAVPSSESPATSSSGEVLRVLYFMLHDSPFSTTAF